MSKVQETPRSKRTTLLIACATIALLATAVIVMVIMMAARTQAPSGDVQTTVAGEFVCLPHKNTDGPQTLECAYGIRTDDNRYYALQFTPFPTDIATGKRAEVTGTLTTGSDSIYNIVGTIKVESYHY
ncbi:MAG TPA: hypothetical protein VM581_03880 [Magnetospirillaceae bacterium]|nr:hypothetical protein [Magnetospirillaceae bacterium]